MKVLAKYLIAGVLCLFSYNIYAGDFYCKPFEPALVGSKIMDINGRKHQATVYIYTIYGEEGVKQRFGLMGDDTHGEFVDSIISSHLEFCANADGCIEQLQKKGVTVHSQIAPYTSALTTFEPTI